MERYDDNAVWREATKREPCPICEKPDWCSLTGPQGAVEAVVCMRKASDNQRANGGWLHKLRDHHLSAEWPTTSAPRPRSSRKNVDRPNQPTLDALVATLKPSPTRVDRYHHRGGEPAGAAIRQDHRSGDKTVKPARRNGDGTWSLAAMPAPRPLYRLPELLASSDATVYVAEGEKAVEALRSIGLTATTWAGGCKAAGKTDLTSLAGRDVVLLPDHDESGRAAMANVAERLETIRPQPSRLRMIELTRRPDGKPAPEKYDAADWIDDHGDAAVPETIVANLAALVEAADPVALEAPIGRLQWQPMPVELLPGCLRDYALEVARVVQADPVASILPGLVTAAAAIGGSRAIALGDDWREPSILWGALVAESGDGKTPAAKPMLAPARAADAAFEPINAESEAQFEDDKRVFAADLEKWKTDHKKGKEAPPPRAPEPPATLRRVVSDVTPEALAPFMVDNDRLLVDRDELSGMLGGMGRYSDGKGAAERAQYLSMHSAEPLRIDRKTGNRRSLHVESPYLSIYGGVQPALLHNVMSADDVAAGMPARFLWAMPPTRRQRYRKDRIRPETRTAYEAAIATLYALAPARNELGKPCPVVVTLSPDAEALFGACVDRLNDRRADATGPIKGALSKLRAACGRLALVIHCLRDADGDLLIGDELTIDAKTMYAATALAEWFAGEAERVFAMRGESAKDQKERDLIRWIEGRGGSVTERDLARGPRVYRGSGVAGEALQALVAAGCGEWSVESTATNQRRVFTFTTPSATAATATATPLPQTADSGESVAVASVATPEIANHDPGSNPPDHDARGAA